MGRPNNPYLDRRISRHWIHYLESTEEPERNPEYLSEGFQSNGKSVRTEYTSSMRDYNELVE